jgi:hypothetical protein
MGNNLTTCSRCGTVLDGDGVCTLDTCPFSDHAQHCPVGWEGHPNHKPGAECVCGEDANGNCNCMVGMQCPSCKQFKKAQISVNTWADFEDGGGEVQGDLEYDAKDVVVCPECKKPAVVQDWLDVYIEAHGACPAINCG